MPLPRGITGFRRATDQPSATTDVRAFRGHCHAVARQTGGRVVSVTAPDADGVVRNFALGTLALPGGTVAVAVNAGHPVVAFAVPLVLGETALRFVDAPELAAAFGAFGVYRVMPIAELERRPTPADLCELSEVERQQVADWRTRRLGDVVFNWWD